MNYKLERQKRKTLSIRIADGEIIVRAPLKTDLAYIESFISQKSDWIAKKLAEYERKTAEFRSVIDGKVMLLCGEQNPIVLSDICKRVKFEDGVVSVPVKYAGQELKAAVAAFKRLAADRLQKRLDEVSGITGLKYRSFALTNAKTKWGSCDGQCNVMLNWRVLMLEPWLMDYVIVHELAHTEHHDHSKAFWTLVGKYYKNHKAAKKRLTEYSVLTSLYR